MLLFETKCSSFARSTYKDLVFVSRLESDKIDESTPHQLMCVYVILASWNKIKINL